MFDGTGTAGPEPVNTWSLVPGFRDEVWIDAYCDTMSHHWRKEVADEQVADERKPVKRLHEVLASGGREKQLQGIDVYGPQERAIVAIMN